MENRLLTMAFVVAMLLPTTSSLASNWADEQRYPEMAESKQICRTFIHATPPEGDRPDKKGLETLQECDAESLYYGIDQPADPVAARACAFAREDGPFTGAVMLMTIYANGVGAKRNLDVAIALACTTLDDSAAAIDGRVKHLYRLRQQNWQGNDFSWCDDVTSGVAQGQCAMHDERVGQEQRDTQLATLADAWRTGPSADRFRLLQASVEAFIDRRTGEEIERSGTAQLAMVVGEESQLRQQFVNDLKGFVDGKPPCAGAERDRDADARLNAAYRTIQRIPEAQFSENWRTVKQDGIKRTELAWLKYRDAWVAFLATADQNISREAVVNWLTLRRLKQLEEFTGE